MQFSQSETINVILALFGLVLTGLFYIAGEFLRKEQK